jgi:hypothetical protein
MDMLPGYIDLDRRFTELNSSDRPEGPALTSYLASSLGTTIGFGWDDLLKERIAVVLGEPGSGKTWELRHRCASMNSQGNCAFFIELERLVPGTVNDALAENDRTALVRWRKSDHSAHFFLDSVDERKILRQSDFYAALDQVRNGIGSEGFERAKFVISSRISEWRPETDKQELSWRFAPRPFQTRRVSACTFRRNLSSGNQFQQPAQEGSESRRKTVATLSALYFVLHTAAA